LVGEAEVELGGAGCPADVGGLVDGDPQWAGVGDVGREAARVGRASFADLASSCPEIAVSMRVRNRARVRPANV
jgi:hypothetical protein